MDYIFPGYFAICSIFWGLKLLCHKKDDFNLLIVNSQKISVDKMQAACKQGRILSCMLQIFVHLVCLTKGSLSKVMLSVKEERNGGTVDWPFILCPIISQTTYTQWRHKSKKSENLGRCGRQNMLRPYLKIWDWELIFGRAVKAISSAGRKKNLGPIMYQCLYIKLTMSLHSNAFRNLQWV